MIFNHNMKEILNELGLTGNEAITYEVLAGYKELTGNSLAQKAGLDRSVTYNVLNSLAQKGLVSSIVKHNKKQYSITDPKNLQSELERKQHYAQSLIEHIKNIQQFSDEDKTVQVYQGVSATRRFYSLLDLEEPTILKTIGGNGEILKRMPEELAYYVKKAKRKHMRIHVLAAQGHSGYKGIGEELFEIRYIPIELVPCSLTAAGNIVYIHDYEHDPRLIIIENAVLAALVASLFDVLWKEAKS